MLPLSLGAVLKPQGVFDSLWFLGHTMRYMPRRLLSRLLLQHELLEALDLEVERRRHAARVLAAAAAAATAAATATSCSPIVHVSSWCHLFSFLSLALGFWFGALRPQAAAPTTGIHTVAAGSLLRGGCLN